MIGGSGEESPNTVEEGIPVVPTYAQTLTARLNETLGYKTRFS